MKYKAKAHYTKSVIYCMPKTTVSTLGSVRYSAVQYGLVRFLGRFRWTFCASFRWCCPLGSRDVTPGDVVDIFRLLGRVLVVEFARVRIHKTTSNAHHDLGRKDVRGCNAACWRIANFVAIPQHLEQFRVDIFSARSMRNYRQISNKQLTGIQPWIFFDRWRTAIPMQKSL